MDPHASLRPLSPFTLAQGGAANRVAADTPEAVTLALKLGADGIESVARRLADGSVVARQQGATGSALRRRSLGKLTVDQLPDTVMTVPRLLELIGPDAHLLLHVGDGETFEAVAEVLAVAERTGETWIATGSIDRLIEWRPRTDSRLILTQPPRRVGNGAERLAAELRSADIDGLGLFHQDWTPGLVTMLNRFGRCTFAWGAEHERELALLFRSGVDAVSSAHPDRLAAVAASFADQPWAGHDGL
ncbi:MAG: hypothetical protein AAGD35_05400 [Actinomycetota bacterium]